MNWLSQLERRFGRYAIPNITLYVIAGQVIATLFGMKQPDIVEKMILDASALLAGDWWRAFTFVLVPQLDPSSLVFAIFWFMFLYSMGQGLEAQWGAFKLNVYMLSGIFFQALFSVLLLKFFGIDLELTGRTWTLSLMLAFAYLYPDFQMLIFFVLPLKMRYFAWIVGAYLIFQIATGGLPAFFEVSFGLANYLIFFVPDYFLQWRLHSSTLATRTAMQKSVTTALATAPRKICQACGKNEREADLRLCTCSRCGEDGKFWCTDDLGAHLKA